MDEGNHPLKPAVKHDTLKQFLDHDRHVLRFYCYWDDREQLYGDAREMVLHYFLSDDTMEIKEVNFRNSGRDAVPMFIRRTKLPKVVEPLPGLGVVTPHTLLNVFGSDGWNCYFINDPLNVSRLMVQSPGYTIIFPDTNCKSL